MFEVQVTTKKGTSVARECCEQGSCTLGKDKESFITLHGWKVAKQHALLEQKDDGVYIQDLDSRSGTRVNGELISPSFGPLKEKDIIEISDYRILVHGYEKKQDHSEQPADNHEPLAVKPIQSTGVASPSKGFVQEQNDSKTIQENETVKLLTEQWRSRVHKELLAWMDLRRMDLSDVDDEKLRSTTLTAIEQIIGEFLKQGQFPKELDGSILAEQVLSEAVGLGPLEQLLSDTEISEIMVNARDQIFFEKNGQLNKSQITFTDDKAVVSAIERIVAPLGRRIDESSPMVDARLKDGSRVNAVIPPLALKGPSITIRKFMDERLTSRHLVDFGSLNPAMVEFLQTCVSQKKNVIISGGTGSGKTTLLNVMSNFIPDKERIVTVEDAAELKLYQSNLVALEARPANQEGKGAISIRELVKNCLRMRPDRIVVGECRGGEALDMLQAMNTGHDGSLTTVHANSPRDCISRLEVLVLMSGLDLPVQAIREQIASAVDIIVQQTRFSCGSRRVTSICEVTGVEGDVVQLSEIFRFRQQGFNEAGKVNGFFTPTGQVPEFYEELRARGLDTNFSLFSTEATQ